MSVVEREVKQLQEAIEKHVPLSLDALDLLTNLGEVGSEVGVENSIESVRSLRKQIRKNRRHHET